MDTRPVVTPYPDGPLLLRGDFRMLDVDGNEIDPGRQTVALCRCGRSGLKPFCDGSHAAAGFRASGADERGGRGAVQGGRAACDQGQPLSRVPDPSP